MCTYNGGEFLEEQLRSIMAQTRPPDELVICDDGSTDETLAIVARCASTTKVAVEIKRNSSRLGPSANFAQAMSLCRGEIIVLSDQDDVWRPDKLQVLAEVLKANPDAGYAFSDAGVIDGKGRVIHRSLWERVKFDLVRRAAFSRGPAAQVRALLKGNVVTGATMALPGHMCRRLLPTPELWIHDEWIAFSSGVMGIRGVPVPEPLIQYRQHEKQAIGLKRTRLVSALIEEPRVYEAWVRKWRAAARVLRGVANLDRELGALLEKKVAHVTLRAQLSRQPRHRRLAAIAEEVARGGYHLCSEGWGAAIYDCLTPMGRGQVEEERGGPGPSNAPAPLGKEMRPGSG
jgi:glycosyltransferase involved in cell wall biosynthesis